MLSQRGIKFGRSLAVTIFMIFIVSSCSMWKFGIEIKVADIPTGISSISNGQLVTFAETRPIRENGQRIRFFEDDEKENEVRSEYPSIATANFDKEIRLVDFYIPEVNEKPVLDFKTTARSLVFMNPLFIGLPLEKRVKIFQDITTEPQFQNLLTSVADSKSIFDDKVVDIASEIALNLAIKHELLFAPDTALKNPRTDLAKLKDESPANDSLQAAENKTFISNFLRWLAPPVNAQTPSGLLEYTVTQQLSNNGKFPGINWPLWHGLELQSDSSGIKIVGTSALAQQIVVFPEGKLQESVQEAISRNAYDDLKSMESNIAGELLILPTETGVWDLSLLKTASGNNQINEPLKPRSNALWSQGSYDVFLSGGYPLNKTSDTQKVGAFDINIALLATDIFALGVGQTDKKPVDVALLLGKVVLDCQNELLTNSTSGNTVSAFVTLNDCLAKPDNIVTIAQAFGITDEQITNELFAQLFRFEGKAWSALAKKTGRIAARVVNIADKGVAVSRIAILGQYLDHELREKDFYKARFNVIDPTQFQGFTVDCLANPAGKFYDLEFSECYLLYAQFFKIQTKNYSDDWYEVERDYRIRSAMSAFDPFNFSGTRDNFRDVRLSTLVAPGEETYLEFNIPRGFVDRVINKNSSAAVEKVRMQVRRYAANPSRDVSINCDADSLNIWGVEITPKCTNEGTYVDLVSESERNVQVTLPNGDGFMLEAQALGNSSGHITSSGRTVNFTLSAF